MSTTDESAPALRALIDRLTARLSSQVSPDQTGVVGAFAEAFNPTIAEDGYETPGCVLETNRSMRRSCSTRSTRSSRRASCPFAARVGFPPSDPVASLVA